MDRINRQSGLKIMRLVLLCLFAGGILYMPRTSFADFQIVAVVNNDAITKKDLDDFSRFMQMQLSSQYQGEALKEKIESLKAELLDKLIEDRLILQEAKRSNIRVEESRVRAKINEIKRQYPSEAAFESALASQGLVQADIETRIREQLLMYMFIDAKVRSRIVVKPSEVTDFYEKHIGEFMLPEKREVEAIAIDDPEKVKSIGDNINKGAGLEEIASRYSLNISELDFFKGDELKKGVSDIIFSLEPGKMSAPTRIGDAYYVFRLKNINPPRQQTLAEVQEKVCDFIFNSKMQEEMNKWLDELKSKSYIKTYS